MSNKVFPGQIRSFYARLAAEDIDAVDQFKLKSVQLVKQGKPVKVLKAKFGDGTYTTSYIFDKKDEPGDYEVHWNFVFNGDRLEPQIDYITLQRKPNVEFGSQVTEEKVIREAPSLNEDDTIPQDVKDLMI